jgi:hypothetical protein
MVNEALALRIKNVQLERHPITIRRCRGSPDRAALLPASCRARLTHSFLANTIQLAD